MRSAAGTPYFNSAPVLPSSVPFQYAGYAFTADGVTLAVGSTATIDVDLYSESPTSGPWTVVARDIEALNGKPATLSFAFDRTSGQNGDVLKLTIHVLASDAVYGGAEPFVVASILGSETYYSFGIVGN